MKNEIVTKQHKGDERSNILQLTKMSYTYNNFQDSLSTFEANSHESGNPCTSV